MCSLYCSVTHSCETSITKTQFCNSFKYILHTEFHKHKYLPYYGFVLVAQMGYAVVQLVEALRYKREGHGFDSQWCHWNFSLT